MLPDEPGLLIDAARIEDRVAELASRISEDHAGNGELLILGVLKGAFVFLADLVRGLTVPHRVDFVTLSSYGDSTTPADAVRWVHDLETDVSGKPVLIVDDVVDTGSTLGHLKETLFSRGASSVKSCVLLSKSKPRADDRQADYVGFEIDDVWVVGYGLDHAGRHRSLPYVGVVDPAG